VPAATFVCQIIGGVVIPLVMRLMPLIPGLKRLQTLLSLSNFFIFYHFISFASHRFGNIFLPFVIRHEFINLRLFTFVIAHKEQLFSAFLVQ